MLDPALWKSRFTLVYNQQPRDVFNLRWQIQSRLTKVEIDAKLIKETWNKAGDLYRLNNEVQVGTARLVSWGQSHQVWPADNFYPYTLQWKPVPWFPRGTVRFWEYTGSISDSDLLDYMQLDTSYQNADLAMQIESLKQSLNRIENNCNSELEPSF